MASDRPWLSRHARAWAAKLGRQSAAIQALGAIVMATAAIGALLVVPYQLAATDRTQREHAAREIYREFLNISIQRADLARSDYCTLAAPVERAAYEAYVEYLLYTAEQVMALGSDDWAPTIAAKLLPHRAWLCTFEPEDMAALTDPVAALVDQLRAPCGPVAGCAGGGA